MTIVSHMPSMRVGAFGPRADRFIVCANQARSVNQTVIARGFDNLDHVQKAVGGGAIDILALDYSDEIPGRDAFQEIFSRNGYYHNPKDVASLALVNDEAQAFRVLTGSDAYPGIPDERLCFSEEVSPFTLLSALNRAGDLYRIRKERTYDGLTGLIQRVPFMKYLTTELARESRWSHPLAVMMADIDNFKQVNDKWGHGAGDFVLRAVANTLGENTRGSDIVARYGGEEFCGMFPGSTPEGIEALAKRILGSVKGSEEIKSMLGGTSLSISLGFFRYEPVFGSILKRIDCTEEALKSNAERMLGFADQALYHVKNNGKNGYSLFPPQNIGEPDTISMRVFRPHEEQGQ